jgi:capsular exopolysaccharide synthesis family protein
MAEKEEKDLIDIKQYTRILTKFWYLPVLFLSLVTLYSFYKLRYTTPIYQINGTIQVKDKSTHAYGAESFLEGASMFQSFKNLNNEIEVIKSYPQVRSVIKELDFQFSYYIKGNLRDIEIYNQSPFFIDFDSGFVLTNVPIHVKFLNEHEYELSILTKTPSALYASDLDTYVDTVLPPLNINKTYKWGELVELGLVHFRLQKTFYARNTQKGGREYFVIARDLNSLVREYKNKIQIVLKTEKSSILKITSTGSSVSKEVDFINKLIEVYITRQLFEKNEIASNTISFIDSQLKIIADSLDITEDNLQAFKSINKINNVSEEALALFEKLQNIESSKLEMEIQNRYYEYLVNYINTEGEFTDLVAPSTINIDDPLLNSLVEQLMLLYQERKTIRYTSSEKSPAYQAAIIKIRAAKEALLENTSNILKSSRYAIEQLNDKIKSLEAELAGMPKKERDYIAIQRKYTINDEIYNYLLEKRAEASIARAANLSDASVIDAARTDDATMIEPKPANVYAFSIFGAILLSGLFVLVYSLYDNKVQVKEDIDKLTGIPLIGAIEQVDSDNSDRLVYGKFNSLTESFRSIRTNLQFYLKGKPSFVVGVTSCVSGDGKTFCSMNLARIYAIGGKKTLLVCGDLRKKMDNSQFGLDHGLKGFSEYLIGSASLDQVIHKSNTEALFIIPSGPMPPNSSELLASEKTVLFIEQVKSMFDVVIFDSPPVGLVSDYVSIMDYLDINLYVIRFNHTPKVALEVLEYLKLKTGEKASHAVVFNGIKAGLMAKYSYAYGYIYSYGYDGTPKPRRTWWQRLLGVKRSR